MFEESNLTGWGMCVWYKLFKLLCLLTDWARAGSHSPLRSLSRLYQAGNLISLTVGDNGNIHNLIKLSNDHRQQHGVNIIDPINRHILLASEQNMCQTAAATPSSNGKYSNCTFLQSFVRSSSSPSNGRCWLTIELFCQYIVKRLQICSNIKGSTLHTSLLTRLIEFSSIEIFLKNIPLKP